MYINTEVTKKKKMQKRKAGYIKKRRRSGLTEGTLHASSWLCRAPRHMCIHGWKYLFSSFPSFQVWVLAKKCTRKAAKKQMGTQYYPAPTHR